jgi:hypothetical protein
MKRILLFILVSLFLLNNAYGQTKIKSVWGQKSYDDIISECYQIDVPNGKFYLSGGNEYEYETRTVEQVASLIKKDVFGYFGLNQKYSTPLQKSAFAKTEEYANYMSEIDYHRSYIFDSKFYILYNLRYNEAYDLNKKAFVINIMVLDFLRTNQTGYLGFGKNINTLFPTNRLNVKKGRESNGEVYAKQYIQIPITDENLALKVEKDMSNPYCSTCLMFVVKLDKTSTEKHPEFMFEQDNILTKSIGLYVVNTKSKEIYCDLTKILSTTK